MPCESVTIPDIEQSVCRPIVFSILAQVAKITMLDEHSEVLYAGKRTVISAPGTTIDDSANKEARFGASKYTFIEVEEDFDLPALQEVKAHEDDHIPVFNDPNVSLSIRPVYVPSNVTITIKYRSPSETEVMRWRSQMFIHASRGREWNLHSAQYTYVLPQPSINLLSDVWKLRNAVAPYGDSLEEYLDRFGTSRLTILTNRAGEHAILGVSESQVEIEGHFDFVGVPDKPTYNRETGTWEISFDYKFTYNRPDAVFMRYPIVVHNQLMPEKYTDYAFESQDVYLKQIYRSKSYQALEMFRVEPRIPPGNGAKHYLKFPEFDDFVIPIVPQGTATVFTALCFVGEVTEPLLTLTDLGDYLIETPILDYLRAERRNLTKINHAFFHIGLYIGDILQEDGLLTVDEELNVLPTKKLDPRKVYRVRFSVVIDVSRLTTNSMLKLSEYPASFVQVLGAVNELLAINAEFQALKDNKKIEDWEVTATYRILAGGMRSNNMTPMDPSYYVNSQPGYVGNWPGGNGNPFLAGIDPKVVEELLLTKRMLPMTAMVSGIITHPRVEAALASNTPMP